MTIVAIIGSVITLAIEILKIVQDARKERKEAEIELKKQQTETIQSIARGIIDRDASRINAGFDKLRRLREKL